MGELVTRLHTPQVLGSSTTFVAQPAFKPSQASIKTQLQQRKLAVPGVSQYNMGLIDSGGQAARVRRLGKGGSLKTVGV